MSFPRIHIGVVGFGKIARDQHLPALASNPGYRLAAVTRGAQPPPQGVAVFESINEMIAAVTGLQAVSVCTPPQGRHAIARLAIDSGLHVMLEKPPGQTLSEIEDLRAAASARSVCLFGTWHSREAPAVEAARAWLANCSIRNVAITWKEDVRRWHPGQSWIWEPGGSGVFDPGINALSIATRILPRPLFLTAAELFYPANCQTPIAANMHITDADGTRIRAEFDFRQTGRQIWDIVVDTDKGSLQLGSGGEVMSIDGRPSPLAPAAEYPNLYRRFAELIGNRAIDVDVDPFRLVADAFMLGRRVAVEPFVE